MEEARRLEAMADRSAALRRDAEAKKQARETPHRPVWRYVQQMMADGMTEGDAVRHAALKHGLIESRVSAIWENALVHDGLVKKWARNREIMRLARAGLQNTEIAAEVGLHPVSISRIIQRELRNAHQWRLSGPLDPAKPWRMK